MRINKRKFALRLFLETLSPLRDSALFAFLARWVGQAGCGWHKRPAPMTFLGGTHVFVLWGGTNYFVWKNRMIFWWCTNNHFWRDTNDFFGVGGRGAATFLVDTNQ